MPSFQRSTLVPYALAAVLVLVLGGRWIATRHRGAPPAAAAPAFASGASTSEAATPAGTLTLGRTQESIVVDVAGAVRRPGVYRLGPGSRIRDALAHAGGPTARANVAAVNRAAKLADGQQIIVPQRVSATPAGVAPSSATAPAAPVSLNGATLEQLDGLPGVGPATAQKILDWRSQHGGFASVDDLGEIPGIGPKKLEALRPKVSA